MLSSVKMHIRSPVQKHISAEKKLHINFFLFLRCEIWTSWINCGFSLLSVLACPYVRMLFCLYIIFCKSFYVLVYGWLREQASWIKSCAVIGCPAGKRELSCPLGIISCSFTRKRKLILRTMQGFLEISRCFRRKTLTKTFNLPQQNSALQQNFLPKSQLFYLNAISEGTATVKLREYEK